MHMRQRLRSLDYSHVIRPVYRTWVYRARREFTKDSLSSLPLDVLAAMDALIGDGFYMAKFSPGIFLFPN
jgi:hypothetical protein